MATEAELIAEKFLTLTEQQIQEEAGRIARGIRCACRRQDLARYKRRMALLEGELARREMIAVNARLAQPLTPEA
jgi:hypothetical protein